MSVTANDLQPKQYKITVQGKDYIGKPLRMSHRLILTRLTPFFKQFENASTGKEINLNATQLLEFENEIDVFIQDILPSLSGVTLSFEDISEILVQVMNSIMPEESKQLAEAKVEVQTDLKAPEMIG